MRTRRLILIGWVVLLWVAGSAGGVLAQGPGEQLCHPAGYCVQVPQDAGWTGQYDAQNNVLSVLHASQGLNYGLQLTYARAMGNESALEATLGILVNALQAAPSGEPQAVTLAGYPGAYQRFTGSPTLGDGMGVILLIGPDILAMGAGSRLNGAWDAAAEEGFLQFIATLTVSPTLNVTQIIGGQTAPTSGVVISTPIPGGQTSGTDISGFGGLSGLGGGTGAGTPSTVLGGSFGTALALTSLGESTPGGVMQQVLILTPTDSGVAVTPTSTAFNFDSLVGWATANGLLIMRYESATLTYNAALYDPASGTEVVVASGLPTTDRYALTPDRARVIAWPASVQDMAPFGTLTVYDAATMARQTSYPVTAANAFGPFLAGVAGERAYFYTRQPGDGLLAVDLNSGALNGPVDLLAAGDGDEFLAEASVSPDGARVAFIGSPSAKDVQGLYSAPLLAPDFLPPLTEAAGAPRPVAVADLHNLAGVEDVTRVFWNHSGSQAAVLARGPDGAGAIFLTDSTFAQAMASSALTIARECVRFTLDDAWLLFVSEGGDSLLAIPASNPTATPETLVSGQRQLSLCDADWQPGSETGGQGGGVTLGGGNVLHIGDTVTGEITSSAPIVEYTITLNAGEVITVTMERLSGDLDTYLRIYDAAGTELIRNDDALTQVGDSFFNSQIVGFLAPAAGTYTIQATRFMQEQGSSSGQYRLSVAVGQVPPPTPIPTITPIPVTVSGGALNVGSTVTGEITSAAPRVNYTITLNAGDTITVTMERLSDTLDTYLRILGPAGNEVAFNDDAATQVGDSGLNSQIVGFVAPAAGTYTIQATRFLQEQGSSSGQYRLSVTRTGAGTFPTPFPTSTPGLPIGGGNDVIVRLVWDNAADMDVAVLPPGSQDWIYWENPVGPSGETLNATQGNDYCRTVSSPAQETITIPAAAAHGTWTVQAQFSLDCNVTSPANWTLTVVQNDRILQSWNGAMDANNSPFRTTFVLP